MRLLKPQSENQQGIVSIMVVSVLVILLSLVTIGFSRLMNRETREALDKQLGVQSYYAAESGVNDAISYINKIKSENGGDASKAAINQCSDDKGKLNSNLSGEATNPNAQYSCVLINPAPAYLQYDIKAGQTKVFSFDQERFVSILFSWGNTDNAGNAIKNNFRPAGTSELPQVGGWTDSGGNPATGALEVSVYPVMLQFRTGGSDNPLPNGQPNPPKPIDDPSLTAKYARTFYLYPNRSNTAGGLVPVDYYDSNGTIIAGKCNDGNNSLATAKLGNGVTYPGPDGATVYPCNAVVNCFPDSYDGPGGSMSLTPESDPNKQNIAHSPPYGCPGHGGSVREEYRAEHYTVKITALYGDTSVRLYAASSARLDSTKLVGAQAEIDSTGKGNDVLRRINARVPLQTAANANQGTDMIGPAQALRTADTICKRIRQLVTNTISTDSSDAACTEGINP